MSRPLRLDHAGAIWHVTSRGNERRDVFRDDADRRRWLDVIGRVVAISGWRIHAYVLMGNHYHLVVETPTPTLSSGMRQLNGIYTQAFNRRHDRVGHLFQGRYKAILVERESHLLELLRYVVLNPVRAQLVPTARNWPWSSYRATAGEGPEVPWLETDWVLLQFAKRRAAAQRRYREFVSEGRNVEFNPWSQVLGQIYLGSEQFAHDASTRAADLAMDTEIPRPQREPTKAKANVVLAAVLKVFGTTHQELLAHPRMKARERGLLAFALRKFAGTTGKQIAPLLGVASVRALDLAREGERSWDEDSAIRKALEHGVCRLVYTRSWT